MQLLQHLHTQLTIDFFQEFENLQFCQHHYKKEKVLLIRLNNFIPDANILILLRQMQITVKIERLN